MCDLDHHRAPRPVIAIVVALGALTAGLVGIWAARALHTPLDLFMPGAGR